MGGPPRRDPAEMATRARRHCLGTPTGCRSYDRTTQARFVSEANRAFPLIFALAPGLNRAAGPKAAGPSRRRRRSPGVPRGPGYVRAAVGTLEADGRSES